MDKKNREEIPQGKFERDAEFRRGIRPGTDVEFAKENTFSQEHIPGNFERDAKFKRDILNGHKGINNNSAFNRDMSNVEFGKDNDFCEDCDGCK